MSESTDLVVRLRLDGSELCLEGASEIERLRELLAKAHATLCLVCGRLETISERLDRLDPVTITDAPPSTPR